MVNGDGSAGVLGSVGTGVTTIGGVVNQIVANFILHTERHTLGVNVGSGGRAYRDSQVGGRQDVGFAGHLADAILALSVEVVTQGHGLDGRGTIGGKNVDVRTVGRVVGCPSLAGHLPGSSVERKVGITGGVVDHGVPPEAVLLRLGVGAQAGLLITIVVSTFERECGGINDEGVGTTCRVAGDTIDDSDHTQCCVVVKEDVIAIAVAGGYGRAGSVGTAGGGVAEAHIIFTISTAVVKSRLGINEYGIDVFASFVGAKGGRGGLDASEGGGYHVARLHAGLGGACNHLNSVAGGTSADFKCIAVAQPSIAAVKAVFHDGIFGGASQGYVVLADEIVLSQELTGSTRN